MYFKFDVEIITNFAKSNKKVRLLDLLTMDSIVLSGEEYEILSKAICDKKSVEECVRLFGDKAVRLFDKFVSRKKASYYENDVFVENIRTIDEGYIKNDHFIKFQLSRLGIELTGNCNLDCRFCTSENVAYRTCGCKKWNDEKLMSYTDYEKLIKDAVKLGLKRIDFLGGEPLVEWDMLKKLIILASKYEIISYVFTNGSLLNQDIIDFFAYYRVCIVIQLFGNSQEEYDCVMNNAVCDYSNIKNAIETMKNKKIQLNLNLIINQYNEDYIEDIEEHFKGVSMQRLYIYPTNSSYSKKYYKEMISFGARKMNANLYTYQYGKYLHNCLYGNAFVACDGNVYPCEMIREKLGNVQNEKIWEIYKRYEHKKYWRITKKDINHCGECENNMICFDCRAIDYCGTGEFTGLVYCDKIPHHDEESI